MDFLLVAPLATTFLLAITTFLYKKLFSNKVVTRKFPEPGFALPIIGHFHLLAANKRPTHMILGEMADKYGPIFRMRLGPRQVMVVSDSRIAKECLTTKDRVLSGRPKSIAAEHIGYNGANFLFVPASSPYWRDVRKVVMLELLSNRRLEALKLDRELGAKVFIQDLYKSWSGERKSKNNEDNYAKEFEMKEWFGKFVIDIMLHILFGHRYKEAGHWVKETFDRNFEYLGLTIVGDYVPWLRWLDIGGHEKAIKENTKAMDSVVENWLQEHKTKRLMKSKQQDHEDIMDAFISRFEDEDIDLNGFDPDTVVKATCTTLLAAATDTTAATLTWALSLIMNNINVLEKIQREIDEHVGKERHVEELDLNNLTYLQAVVKETLRLYPSGPLLSPHEAIEDCEVDGYHVSKGTRLLINVSKIQRDSRFWSDPEAFKPERFLTENIEVDVRGQHFDLLPFGGGRRMCPGITFGLKNVQLGLGSLIHAFDIKKALDEPIDMTEVAGLSVTKATPLQVLLTPRLPSHLYR